MKNTLNLVADRLLEDDYIKACESESSFTEISIDNNTEDLFVELILALPEKIQFVLYSKYVFYFSAPDTEIIYGITNVKGLAIYWVKSLSKTLGLSDDEIISTECLESALTKALDLSTNTPILKIHSKNKPNKLIKLICRQVAAALLIVVIGLGSAMVVNAEFRELVINFIVETFERYTSFEIASENDASIDFDNVSLGYIPDGFVLTDTTSDLDFTLITYSNTSNDISIKINISTSQRALLNTENSIIEEIYIDSLPAYKWSNNNINYLAFSIDEKFFTIYGEISFDDIQNIAKEISLEK